MSRIRGVSFWPSEEEDVLLLELIVVDESRRASWSSPTEDDVRQACRKFKLPFGELMRVIKTKAPDSHTILIDVPQWKSHLGMTFCTGEHNCPATKHANDCPKWEE